MGIPKFDMDVKLKNSIVKQNYTFSETNNEIKIGDFTIKKENDKWHLEFPRDKKEFEELTNKIALEKEKQDKIISIELNKVTINASGNVEFELAATQDRKTQQARNFTITPNSVIIKSTKTTQRDEVFVVGPKEVMDVTLPKNFPQLFLGNETSSTTSSELPVELFATMFDHADFFESESLKTHTLKNQDKKSIRFLQFNDKVYTLVNSKMMKVEKMFFTGENQKCKAIFNFKKGKNVIGRFLDNVDINDLTQFFGDVGYDPHITDDTYYEKDVQESLTYRDKSRAKTASNQREDTTFTNVQETKINETVEKENTKYTFDKKKMHENNQTETQADQSQSRPILLSGRVQTDENKHLYDDTTLSTQGLAAREFATTDKSREKNASTFEAVETTPEQTQDEPETSGDSNGTEEIELTEETEPTGTEGTEETEPTGTEETEGIIADSTNQENETGNEASTEENKDEKSEENKDEKGINEQADTKEGDKKDDKADNKKEKEEKYKFSSAPLFYIGGLLLGILGILTGFAWLLVLAFMMFAAPKLTEGIVNDAKKVKVEKASKRQKMSKQEKALIKQKNKDLRRARTSLKNKSKNFKLSPEWQETTSKLFDNKTLTKDAKDALNKIQPNNIQRDKILEHSNKIRETEKYINQIEKDIAKNKYNEETTEKLRNVISVAKQDLENAKKSNNAILEKYDIANGIVDAANSDKLTQNKLAAGMNALGIEPNQIYDTSTDTSILNSEEKIADINEMLAQNYSDYGLDISKYLAKDGLLDEEMKEINSIIEPPTKTAEKTEVKEKDGESLAEPTAETEAETSTLAPTPEATPTPAPEVAKILALEDPKPVKAPEVTRER